MGAVPADGVGCAGVLLTEAEGDADSVALGVADSETGSGVDEGSLDGELPGLEVAGAVLGVDGRDGVLADPSVSAPIVVVPDVCEAPTSAETGRCPISSIPVTMPIARRKTAAVLRATRDKRGRRRCVRGRRGSRSRGSRGPVLGGEGRGDGAGPANWVRAWRSRSLVLWSDDVYRVALTVLITLASAAPMSVPATPNNEATTAADTAASALAAT